ncbi:MAG: hypothetical protein M1834_000525 [Cirrosporium novae-zelandiae]|nr:MAG: hypothetical protein M1834_000525 [Cirrosporium novae-zelandiae]
MATDDKHGVQQDIEGSDSRFVEAVPFEDLSPAVNRRILRKTDAVIMPILIVAMTLAFLDKNGMAYAAVWGMKTDAHLKGQEYSWLGSIFYFGYLGMEFPTLWLLSRVPIGKWVGGSLTCWGIALCCMAACSNFAGLATIRFLLGVFEAGMLPCFMVLNSMWYCKEEQPLRTALWYNTFAGVFGGILSYAIGKNIHGALSTWRVSIEQAECASPDRIQANWTSVGIAVIFLLPDSPAKAWFLSEKEKELAVLRTAVNQTGVENKKAWKKSQVIEALQDLKYWTVAIFIIAQAITNAGVTNFNPLIIAGYGFSTAKTTLMATPQAAVAMVSQTILTTITFFVPNLRCIFWVLSSLVALAGAIMVHLLDATTSRDASLAGVYLMGFYNVPWVLMLSLQTSNTAGMTKKSFVSVSTAVFYAVGNIIGPQFFLDSQSPTYSLGIGAMLFSFAVMAACGLAYWAICFFENKRRDRVFGEVGVGGVNEVVMVGLDVDREDRTDGENEGFRYTY